MDSRHLGRLQDLTTRDLGIGYPSENANPMGFCHVLVQSRVKGYRKKAKPMESSVSVLDKEKNSRHVVEVPARENTSGRELITNQESRKMHRLLNK